MRSTFIVFVVQVNCHLIKMQIQHIWNITETLRAKGDRKLIEWRKFVELKKDRSDISEGSHLWCLMLFRDFQLVRFFAAPLLKLK